jgi:hypothetical protein
VRCLEPLVESGRPVVLTTSGSPSSLKPLLSGGLGFRVVRLEKPTERELREILASRFDGAPSGIIERACLNARGDVRAAIGALNVQVALRALAA